MAELKKILPGLVAGFVLVTAVPAGAANVGFRVEGAGDTLIARTVVSTSAGSFTKDGDPSHSCSNESAGGALERATAGDWGGRWASFGDYEVQAIKGERYESGPGDSSGNYWSFWVNYRPASTGICGTTMQEGDDVLLFPDCFGQGCVNPTPLRITAAPASARPAEAFEVKVVELEVTYDSSFNPIVTETPSAAATVTAGGRSFTTGADGVARVTIDSRSTAAVRASKPSFVRTATSSVCVECGAVAAPAPAAARDSTAPETRLALRNGATFSRRSAPRLLRGSVAPDPSGLRAVKLRLTRRVGGRCSYFSGKRETWRASRCGRAFWFAIGDRADWSYLLPARLARGSYVLEAKAIDGAFNRGAPARVRFRVR